MRSLRVRVVCAWGVLALAGGGAFILPVKLPQTTMARPLQAGRVIRLTGKLWDMPSTHPDMQVVPAGGWGPAPDSKTLGRSRVRLAMSFCQATGLLSSRVAAVCRRGLSAILSPAYVFNGRRSSVDRVSH